MASFRASDCRKYQYLLGKVSTNYDLIQAVQTSYQYLLGKVSTSLCLEDRISLLYQYLLGKVSTFKPENMEEWDNVSISIR